MPTSEPAAKVELQRLIEQLNELLQQAPPEKQEAAEAVAQSAEALVNTAAADKLNKTMLQITGEGLKQAAQTLADVIPNVLSIATQIVAAVFKLTS